MPRQEKERIPTEIEGIAAAVVAAASISTTSGATAAISAEFVERSGGVMKRRKAAVIEVKNCACARAVSGEGEGNRESGVCGRSGGGR